MKYIKQFESVEGYPTKGFPVELTKVQFGIDGVTALYIRGDLHIYGDHYNDKIDDYLKGFINGLKWSGINVEYKKIECSNAEMVENICGIGNPPPNILEDVEKANSVNELFGNVIRNIKYVDEFNGHDITEYLSTKENSIKISYKERRGKTNELIKTYLFKMKDDSIKVELSNWLKIKTPGLTEYNIYINDDKQNISNTTAKRIYNLTEKLYTK
jgi:hypothetical protein